MKGFEGLKGNLRTVISDASSVHSCEILSMAHALKLETAGRCPTWTHPIIQQQFGLEPLFIRPKATKRDLKKKTDRRKQKDPPPPLRHEEQDKAQKRALYHFLNFKFRTMANVQMAHVTIIYNPTDEKGMKLAANFAANELFQDPLYVPIKGSYYRPRVYEGTKPKHPVFVLRNLNEKSAAKLTEWLLKKHAKSVCILGDRSFEQRFLPPFLKPILERVQKV